MKQKTPELGMQTRVQIAQTLPDAMTKAIESYQSFMDGTTDQKAGEFKDIHMAAKAALAHVELLLKLAMLVDVVPNNQGEKFLDLMKSAQAELEGQDE